jgi:hypothetical protein
MLKHKHSWGVIANGLVKCTVGVKVDSLIVSRNVSEEFKYLVGEQFAIYSFDVARRKLRVGVKTLELLDRRYYLNYQKLIEDSGSIYVYGKKLPSNALKHRKTFKCPRCGWPE